MGRVMKLVAIFSAWAVIMMVAPAQFAQASQVDVLVEKLVNKGVLTRLDAESMKAEIETAEKTSFLELRKETNPWLEGLTSKGDIRLRMEGFDDEEIAGESDRDRLRGRVRVRWGLEKKFNDEWKAGFRLSTGPNDEAVSTNQTLENDFNFKNLWLNRAYGIYTPTKRFQEYFSAIDHVEIGAGKVANPHKKWGTSLVWDSDVEPEGIYEKIDFKLSEWGKKGNWKLHTLAGQWLLDESSGGKDVNMNSYGIGTSMKSGDGKQSYAVKYVFYDWQNYVDRLDGVSTDAIAVTPLGTNTNDFQTDEFKIHSIYAEAGFKDVPTVLFGNQPVKVFGQYVNNAEEGNGVTNVGQDVAWTAGVKLGKAKKKGTWEVGYQYYEIEQNSTVSNFSESDIGGGGTNREAHKFAIKYQLLDKLQLAWSNWFVDNTIIDSTLR